MFNLKSTKDKKRKIFTYITGRQGFWTKDFNNAAIICKEDEAQYAPHPSKFMVESETLNFLKT